MGLADFCAGCGEMLIDERCKICENEHRAKAIIEGRVTPPGSTKNQKAPPAGKHDLPIGLRDDAHRRGKGTGET
jgi:hypothetical protein